MPTLNTAIESLGSSLFVERDGQPNGFQLEAVKPHHCVTVNVNQIWLNWILSLGRGPCVRHTSWHSGGQFDNLGNHLNSLAGKPILLWDGHGRQ